MADYYRKTVNNTANDVRLKMQMAAFILKLSENINEINEFNFSMTSLDQHSLPTAYIYYIVDTLP